MRTMVCLLVLATAGGCAGDDPPPSTQPSGQGESVFTTGNDPTGPFFRSIGTNQRTCGSCHDQASGWSITPTAIQAVFDASDGTDPLFRSVDGATRPTADVSTLDARRAAYSMLLTKGLIRVGQPIPDGAEFTLSAVTDPYGFASATELSLFRRPLPSTNLKFLSQIMWDSREGTLDTQAMDATLGHAQAMTIDDAVMPQIVAFESQIYTAQRYDEVAGDLASDGALGGAQGLVAQTTGTQRTVFTIFQAWTNADRSTPQGARRASIARGEQIFNTERVNIRGVAGLLDQTGTCATCHDASNVGDHATAVLMNIGISDDDRRTADEPLYTLTNKADGRTVRTTDPGAALVTGKWADIAKFKVPSLRGLAMRPPYFHNGMAKNLDEVVEFYRRRFGMRLSDSEQVDLVAFLSAL